MQLNIGRIAHSPFKLLYLGNVLDNGSTTYRPVSEPYHDHDIVLLPLQFQTCSARYTTCFDFTSKDSQKNGCGYMPRLVNALSSKLGGPSWVFQLSNCRFDKIHFPLWLPFVSHFSLCWFTLEYERGKN